jgi:peptide/nickel transport system substrate-binding protein
MLAGAGAGATAGVLLAACGGGGEDRGVKGDKSGLLSVQEDTSKQAKVGETLKLSMTNDIPSWEPNMAFTVINQGPGAIQGRLIEQVPGRLEPARGEVVGGAAESWEWSPDRLQLTLKLRPDAMFHPVAPVNGRAMDVEDVVFSWERLKRVGTIRSEYANDVNANAPILSITAVDSRTISVKIKEPLVYVLAMLAHVTALTMLPKEMDSQFDPRTKAIGSGPFYVSDYKPSIGATLKRNPGYYVKGLPYAEQVELPIVQEYSQGLAQLKTGALHTYPVRPDDVVGLKRDTPQLQLYQGDIGTLGNQSIFGWQGDSPFKDERVRQAYSMLMDRDLLIDVARNVTKFKNEGLPVETRWNTNLQCTFNGWWLDPQSKEFGPNAKYFEHNVAEAKKLLAAAGHANGLEVLSSHITTNEYGTDFPKLVEVVEGMMAEGGFRFKKNIVNYANEFIPKYRDAKGNFEGLSYKSGPTPPANDAVAYLVFFNYSKGGNAFYGFDAAGRGDNSGDPKVDELLLKARGEVDNEKRRALVYEVQQYLGAKQYNVRWAGGSSNYSVAWPAVKNFDVFRGEVAPNFFLRYWLDANEPPLKRA